MKEKLANLINVKTIVTFSLVGSVIYLGITGAISPDKMYTLGFMVVSFYFGTQVNKTQGV